MAKLPECCEKVWWNYTPFPCGKKARYERDGKHYCGIHDPVAAEERARRRAEKAKPKRDAEIEVFRRQQKMHEACEGVPTDQLRPGLLAELRHALMAMVDASKNDNRGLTQARELADAALASEVTA